MGFWNDIFGESNAEMMSFIEEDNVRDLEDLLENGSIRERDLNKTISVEGTYMSSFTSYVQYEMTPLCAAAFFESPRSMKWLLENGAQSSINKRAKYHEDVEDLTPLMIAVDNGNLECVKILLNYNANTHLNYTYSDNEQYNAFMMACYQGYTEIVNEFIKRRLVNLKDQNNFGNTPLHAAILSEDKETIEILLKNGATVCLDIKNDKGQTPLDLANNDVKAIINTFLDKWQANPKTNKNISDTASKNTQTSIMTPSTNTQTAEQSKATETVQRKSIDAKQSSGYSKALMVAVAMDNAEEIEKILQDKSININATDCFGNTPLLVAIASGSNKAVQALLKHNADIDIKSAQGLKVEEVARTTQNAEAIQLISHTKILRCSLKEQNQRA